MLSDALVLTAVAMLAPIYAAYVSRLGGDILEAGLTAAALAFGAGFASLVSGKYIDKLHNKKLAIVFGYGVMGICFLLYTVVGNIWELALVQLIIGLVRPIYEPAFDALYSVHLDKSKEAEEWGAWEAMSYFAAGAGALLGGFIVNQYGFTPLFVGMAGLCFISSLYVLKLPKKVL